MIFFTKISKFRNIWKAHLLKNHEVSILLSLRSRTLRSVFFFKLSSTGHLGDHSSQIKNTGLYVNKTKNPMKPPILSTKLFMVTVKGSPSGLQGWSKAYTRGVFKKTTYCEYVHVLRQYYIIITRDSTNCHKAISLKPSSNVPSNSHQSSHKTSHQNFASKFPWSQQNSH